MTKRRGHTWANWLRKKRTAPINFEFKTHHAAKGRQLKRVYDMVREFHTRDEEEENSLELLFSPSGILSYVLRRKTLYRKFVKKKKKERRWGNRSDGFRPKSDVCQRWTHFIDVFKGLSSTFHSFFSSPFRSVQRIFNSGMRCSEKIVFVSSLISNIAYRSAINFLEILNNLYS